jgi:hypothetical protein
MIELVALDEVDGLLFYRQAGDTFALRPPYSDAPTRVPEAAVARAIGDHGFEAKDLQFTTLEQMVSFVRQQADGAPGEGDGPVAPGLLRVAPAPVLQRFLDRAERELLPTGAVEQAERLLRAMLAHSSRLRANDELKLRAERLLAEAVRVSTGRTGRPTLSRRPAENGVLMSPGRRTFTRRSRRTDAGPPSHPGE